MNTTDEDGVGSFGDFMAGIEESMTNLMKASAKAPKDAYEHYQAFTAAINWKEKWIQALLAFHVFLFLITIFTRKKTDIQACIFFTICVIVFFLERINEYGSHHWREFATQNYFDKHGAFMGFMVATPLLLICFFQLLNFLGLASSALIEAKRLELKRSRSTNASATETTQTTATASTSSSSSSSSTDGMTQEKSVASDTQGKQESGNRRKNAKKNK